MPIGSCPYDYKVHQRQLGSKQLNAYEDPTSAHVIAEDAASPFISSQQLDFQHRNDAVGELSPFEMAIMFTTDNVASSSTKALMFQRGHPSKGNQGLQPRQTMVIPQQFGDPPMRPDDTAEPEDLEAWANFALGNFFPYDRYLHLLKGDTIWAKFLYWCEHKPRGALDQVAMKFLGNIHTRNLARQEMKKDLNIKVVRRGDMVHANHDEEVGEIMQPAHDTCTYTWVGAHDTLQNSCMIIPPPSIRLTLTTVMYKLPYCSYCPTYCCAHTALLAILPYILLFTYSLNANTATCCHTHRMNSKLTGRMESPMCQT
jgi:hypothetical protein